MPAPCSHEPAGASAESTQRDQLVGERNVRCWELGQCHRSVGSTAAHLYCLLLAPHLHFYAVVFTHSRWLQSCGRHVICVHLFSVDLCKCTLVLTRVSVDVFTEPVISAQICPLLPYFVCLYFSKILMIVGLFFHTVCSHNLLDCEVTEEIRLSPSTHLLAGHLAPHLKKEKQSITVKPDDNISYSLNAIRITYPKTSLICDLFYWYPFTAKHGYA